MCDPGYVVGAIYVFANLVVVPHSNILWWERAHLCHGQIPVLLHNVVKLDEGDRNHPIFDWGWIWIERKYLQLYRVEVVYLNRRLGVGVQVFIKLFQDGMYFERCLRRRQKRRLFLQVSEYMLYLRDKHRYKLTSHAVRTRFTFRTMGS